MNFNDIYEKVSKNIDEYNDMVLVFVRHDGSHDLVSTMEKNEAFKVLLKTSSAMVDDVITDNFEN